MGILKHLLLGDLGQSSDILESMERLEAIKSAQKSQSRRHSSQTTEIVRLTARTEKLHLAVTALSRFLIEKGVIAESELADFLDIIDQEDGALDGKLEFADERMKPRVNLAKPGSAASEVPKIRRSTDTSSK